RDQQIAEQRLKLNELHVKVQGLRAAAVKAESVKKLKVQMKANEQKLAEQQDEITELKKLLNDARASERSTRKELSAQMALRDKRIQEQRKTLVELEAKIGQLKKRLSA